MIKRTKWILGILAAAGAAAQTAPPGLTVGQAVAAALRVYPSIRVNEEQMNAAAARIRLAQTAYLPHVDTLVQVNRATRNTFYGLLLPQGVIPGVDGVPSNNFGTVWDSGAGILVTWEPFDFGLRAANVAAASAARQEAEAGLRRTRFEVAVAAADAFLTALAAEETAKAARAAVSSWETLARTIHGLVAAQLRPGADESRVQAELAAARTQLAQAEQAIDVARAAVAQFTGPELAELRLEGGRLVDSLPPDRPELPLQVAANPLAVEQNAVIARDQALLQSMERIYRPQFFVEGVAAARGTGLDTNGARPGALNGLAPTTQNYGLGLTVTFPVMDRFAVREEQAAQAATIRAGQAQYRTVATGLSARFQAALARLRGARRVAENTPVEVSSARTALQQASARYQAGLAPIDDVAQAERLLAAAEIDNALARLSVWRGLLDVAATRGDVSPFLAQAGS